MHVDEARPIPAAAAAAATAATAPPSPVAVTPGSSTSSSASSSNGTSKKTTTITPLKRRMELACQLVQLDDDDDDQEDDDDEVLVGYNDDDDENRDHRDGHDDFSRGPDVVVPLGQPLSSFIVDMVEDDCSCPVTPSSPIGCSNNNNTGSNKFLKTSHQGRRKVRNSPRRKDRTFTQRTTAKAAITSVEAQTTKPQIKSLMTVSARRFDAAPMKMVEGMMMRTSNNGNGPSSSSRSPRSSIPRSFHQTMTVHGQDDLPLPSMPPCPPSEDIARISSELYELCLFRNYRNIVSQSSSSDDDTDDDNTDVSVL